MMCPACDAPTPSKHLHASLCHSCRIEAELMTSAQEHLREDVLPQLREWARDHSGLTPEDLLQLLLDEAAGVIQEAAPHPTLNA